MNNFVKARRVPFKIYSIGDRDSCVRTTHLPVSALRARTLAHSATRSVCTHTPVRTFVYRVGCCPIMWRAFRADPITVLFLLVECTWWMIAYDWLIDWVFQGFRHRFPKRFFFVDFVRAICKPGRSFRFGLSEKGAKGTFHCVHYSLLTFKQACVHKLNSTHSQLE